MSRQHFLIPILIMMTAAACSDPQCPLEFEKVGKVCRRIPQEGGPEPKDDDAAIVQTTVTDASNRTDTPDSASTDAAPPSDVEECMPGDDVTCSTTCGTEGSGICTVQGTPPEGSSCAVPSEVCNWKDDDCDGIVDPKQLRNDVTATDVWTQAGAPSDVGAQTFLLERPGGGAWLLYGSASAGKPGLVIGQLDARGRRTTPPGAFGDTGTITQFVANASSTQVVVAAFHAEQTGLSVRVHLFRRSDMAPVSSFTIQGTTDICARGAVSSVAAVDLPNGTTGVAIARSLGTNLSTATGQCDVAQVPSFSTDVFTTSFKGGQWSTPKKVIAVGASGLVGYQVILDGLPCRAEFVAAYAYPTIEDPNRREVVLSRIGADGTATSPTRLTPSTPFISSLVGKETCDGNDTILFAGPVLGSNGSPAQIETHVYAIQVDANSGHFSTPRMLAKLPSAGSVVWPVLSVGASSLWAAGQDTVGLARLFRLPLAGEGANTFEEVSVPTLTAPKAPADPAQVLGAYGLSAGAGHRRIDVGVSGEAAVVAESMVNTATANGRRRPGDTSANAIVATYAASCP